MAEVLINLNSEDYESRKLAKYDFVKLNITESITLEQLNEEIFRLQKKLNKELNEYEEQVKSLETFVKQMSTGKNIARKSNISITI